MNATLPLVRQRGWLMAACAALLAGTMSVAGAGIANAHVEHGHPARIHKGTCESLQGVAYRLNGVGGSVDTEGAPVATPAAVNPATTYQVMTSESVIDAPIDELLTGDHSIMVYESDEAMEGISCGNIGGAMMGDELITGLAEMRIPGHLGFAIFTPNGDQTDVTIIIGHAMAPVSAGGTADGHEHSEGESNHEDEEEAHATPEA